MYGKDYEYADTRLRGTIVREGKTNKPIVVDGINMDTGRVHYHAFGWEQEQPDKLTLDDVDVRPSLLGFCNVGRKTVYLSRVPRRGGGYRQGLRIEGLYQVPYGTDRVRPQSPDLYRCIMGDYPDFKAIVRSIEQSRSNGKSSGTLFRAWHRHWALSGNYEVVYKTFGVVGYYDRKSDRIVLNDAYSYLEEAMEESL